MIFWMVALGRESSSSGAPAAANSSSDMGGGYGVNGRAELKLQEDPQPEEAAEDNRRGRRRRPQARRARACGRLYTCRPTRPAGGWPAAAALAPCGAVARAATRAHAAGGVEPVSVIEHARRSAPARRECCLPPRCPRDRPALFFPGRNGLARAERVQRATAAVFNACTAEKQVSVSFHHGPGPSVSSTLSSPTVGPGLKACASRGSLARTKSKPTRFGSACRQAGLGQPQFKPATRSVLGLPRRPRRGVW